MARGTTTLAVVGSTEPVSDATASEAGAPPIPGPSPAPPPHAASSGPAPGPSGPAGARRPTEHPTARPDGATPPAAPAPAQSAAPGQPVAAVPPARLAPVPPDAPADTAAEPVDGAARTALTPARPGTRPSPPPASPGPPGERPGGPTPLTGPGRPVRGAAVRPSPRPRPRPDEDDDPRTTTVARPDHVDDAAPTATTPAAGDVTDLVETGPPTAPRTAVTAVTDLAAAARRGAPEAAPSTPSTPAPGAVDVAEAEEFLRLFHDENPAAGSLAARLAAVREEIAETGTYVHTTGELEYGARVAWRNSARCIGRLYWRSLHLRDRRDVVDPEGVADECVAHLRESTRRGRVRSTITVFAPDTPTAPGPRVWNEQLVRYAGYRAGGAVLGDPRYVGFTDTARSLGWVPPSPMGGFDVLPLIVSGGGDYAAEGPHMAEVPADAVLEVALSHPDHEWFAGLGLQWHAVPAISNMRLDIGGITYPAAPFNGWYMATEIGARNLADPDRYDLLGEIAEAMGLDTSSERTMWRDRAAVELTLAVQHSFDTAGVTLADHHGESARFLRHVEREEAAGRTCPVDWSWIVPPISGGLTPVFHRYYDEPTDTGPMFRLDDTAKARGRGCPI